MTCINPPELSELELLRFNDGEAAEAVRAHIEACQHCRQRAVELAQWQTNLTSRVFRHDCPEPMILAELQTGQLTAAQAGKVRNHVRDCPYCKAEITKLDQFLDLTSSDLEISTLDRVRVMIGRLMEGPGQQGLTLQPAMAGVRGSVDGPRYYRAGELQVAINTERDPDNPGRMILFGALSAPKGSGWQVMIIYNSELIDECAVDSNGNFFFANLKSTTYSIQLINEAQEIILPEVRVD